MTKEDAMTTRDSIARLGQALGLLFAVLYALCVAWDASFPDWAMRSIWAAALPGFDWLSAGDFFLGLAESYVYGWILAILFIPIWYAVGAERPGAGQWLDRRLREPHAR